MERLRFAAARGSQLLDDFTSFASIRFKPSGHGLDGLRIDRVVLHENGAGITIGALVSGRRTV